MKSRFIKSLLFATVSALNIFISCTESDSEANSSIAQGEDKTIVSVKIAGDSYGLAATKSSFSWKDDGINDVEIVVTDEDGNIETVIYSKTMSSLTFEGTVGRTYYIWGAANMGEEIEVGSLSDFINTSRTVNRAQIEKNGIPMFSANSSGEPGPAQITISGSNDRVTVHLVRMMARIDFKVNKSGLENPDGFNIDGIVLYNAIGSYLPFADKNMQTHGGKHDSFFDNATDSDLDDANMCKTVSLYAFENMQGDLLPANGDPWRKVPSSIGTADGCCSYLEMHCSYVSGSLSCDDITYRMYLGEDSTSNFDVKRNTKYSITLYPSEEEIDGHRGSWKIESSGWGYDPEVTYRLEIHPAEGTIEVGGTLQYEVEEWKYEDGVEVYHWEDISSVCNWKTSDLSVASVNDRGLAIGNREGSVVVTADYRESNGITYSVEAELTVFEPASAVTLEYIELVMDPDEINIGEKSYGTVTAYYSDGSSTNVSDSCTWSDNAPNGIFTGNNAGGFTVSAYYDGVDCSDDVFVIEPVVPVSIDLVMSPGEIEIGEESFGTVTIHYSDGTDVILDNSDCDWTNASDGVFIGEKAGTFTVTAYYDGISDSDEVTVSEPVAPVPVPVDIELEMNPDEIEIGEKSYGTVSIHYSDGTVDTVSNSDCTWTNAIDGVFTAAASGTFIITVEYNGLTASDSVKVNKHIPVFIVTPSVNFLETWGGNDYAVEFTATMDGHDLGFVTDEVELVDVVYESGVPSGMHEWKPGPGKIYAEDWWGMTGDWAKMSHSFTLVFNYEGVEIRIPGVMNGTVSMFAAIGDRGMIHYTEYEDIRDGIITSATIYGIGGPYDVTDNAELAGFIGGKYYQGFLDMGNYQVKVAATDPTNGLTRVVTVGFSVETNIADIHTIVEAFINGTTKLTGGVNAYLSSSSNVGTAGLPGTEDYSVSFDFGLLTFDDYKGETYSLLGMQRDIPRWVQWNFDMGNGTYHREQVVSGWVEINGEILYWDIEFN